MVFDKKFSTTRNDTSLSDTTIESIFNDLFITCSDYFGEETIAPEGATARPPPPLDVNDMPPKLSDKWLSEPERRDKKARADSRQAQQHGVRQQQAKDFEKLNAKYNPPYPQQSNRPPPEPPQIYCLMSLMTIVTLMIAPSGQTHQREWSLSMTTKL